MKIIKSTITLAAILFSVQLMAQDNELYDEKDVDKHKLLFEYKAVETGEKSIKGSGFYYVYCIDEGKRIGNYNSDLKVINNRASNHSYKKGHNTKVYEK